MAVDGTYVHVTGAALPRPPRQHIPIYFGGASAAATARHADTYLLWTEPLEAVAQRIDTVRALAAATGRTLRSACASMS